MMDQQWKKIAGLELKTVRDKFAAKKSWWWNLGHSSARIEREYRQFLFLLVTHPDKAVVPWSTDVKEFWREHILDKRKYGADCRAIAGKLIEHHSQADTSSPEHTRAFADTRKLYLASFGQTARKRRRTAGEVDFSADTPMVFSEGGRHGHHGSHHASHPGWGHHDAGQHAGGDHGGGGHAGHGCGGHSGCGGHGH